MTVPSSSNPVFSNPGFSTEVSARFGRQARTYANQARLQQGVAWRLAHLCTPLPVPNGPRGDLGAGSGLVGQALASQGDPVPLLQLDLCAELLAHNPLAKGNSPLVWDLNQGLPATLRQAALLTSSFALQWLDDPAAQLQHWCGALGPGGWLALAVPTAASFPEWHRAVSAAGVPCTALPLPHAEELVAAARNGGLELRHCRQLTFSRAYGSGLGFLQQLKTIGASASRSQRLDPGQLRRLLACWPDNGRVSWEVLVLLGQRPER
jgi:malonyl-CoA O-methyltransferase